MTYATSKSRALLIALLLTASAVQAAAEITPSSLGHAVAGLKNYCIERMCLGMTVPQVEALGQMTWDKTSPADGRQSCDLHKNSARASFKAADGTAMELVFDPVMQTGSPMARYRLLQISLTLPEMTSMQVTSLFRTLTARYGPMEQERKDVSGITRTKDKHFSIIIIKFDIGGRGKGSPAEISLDAIYRYKTEWLMSLPVCKVGLPKI